MINKGLRGFCNTCTACHNLRELEHVEDSLIAFCQMIREQSLSILISPVSINMPSQLTVRYPSKLCRLSAILKLFLIKYLSHTTSGPAENSLCQKKNVKPQIIIREKQNPIALIKDELANLAFHMKTCRFNSIDNKSDCFEENILRIMVLAFLPN